MEIGFLGITRFSAATAIIYMMLAITKVKDAIRKRARGKQPDANDEVADGAPKPKGKGRGKGRKTKNPQPAHEPAASTEQQVEPEKKDETGKLETASPNKRPSKSRKRVEPANQEDAAKAKKDAWASKDWCLISMFKYTMLSISNQMCCWVSDIYCVCFRSWSSKLRGSLFLLISLEIESRIRCQRTVSNRAVLLVCCAL